jgi:hypothetical protein
MLHQRVLLVTIEEAPRMSCRTAGLQARLMCFEDGAYMKMSGPGDPRSGKN